MTTALTTYLNEIKQRMENALPGPWEHIASDAVVFVPKKEEGTPGQIVVASPGWADEEGITLDEEHDTCEFIAHARTDVDHLLRIVEVQQKALEELQGTDICAPWRIATGAIAAVEAIAKGKENQ